MAAAAGYVSNWWLIAQNSSYFSRFAPPTPLGHLWSLAVEEQFYLIWPWLILLGLYLTRSRGEQSRRRWLAGSDAGAGCGIGDADGGAVPSRLRPDAGL